MSKRKVWIDREGLPVLTHTKKGEEKAKHWGWIPAVAVPARAGFEYARGAISPTGRVMRLGMVTARRESAAEEVAEAREYDDYSVIVRRRKAGAWEVDEEEAMADATAEPVAEPSVTDSERAVTEPSDQVMSLIRDLTDPGECRFDHHGGCQEHGYLTLKAGEKCPHAEAKELLSEWKFVENAKEGA